MLDDLLRFKFNQKYLVWDVETESLSLHYSRPWQLAFLVCQNNEILETHNYHIWWDDLNVSADAARITKFNYDNYKEKAKDPKEILEIFEKYLYNENVINLGHNLLNFDVYIHNTMRRCIGLKSDWSYLHRLIDTNSVARAYKNGIKLQPTDNLLEWQTKLSNFRKKGVKTSLGILGKEFDIKGIDFENLHDAVEDIKLNWAVFQHLIKNFEL